jgi:hypothetical protein
MKYVLLIHDATDWRTIDPAEAEALLGEYMAVNASPAVIGGSRLAPADTATTVRVRDGRMLTTDGPFVETREALGGFFEVEADHLDEALELAARIPAARMGGGIEVRPVVER